jgi:hypothetical protein
MGHWEGGIEGVHANDNPVFVARLSSTPGFPYLVSINPMHELIPLGIEKVGLLPMPSFPDTTFVPVRVRRWVEDNGLTLHPTKTRLVNASQVWGRQTRQHLLDNARCLWKAFD